MIPEYWLHLSSRAHRGAPLLAAAVTAALLAGCSSAGGPPPIQDGGHGSLCLTAPRWHYVVDGGYSLPDIGKTSATVTGIRFPHMHGLKVTSAWLTPILTDPSDGDHEQIGFGFAWPPHENKIAREEWARRVPLIGAVIKPGQDPNLSFGVARTGTSAGRSDPPLVTYTSDGHTYTANEGFAIVVAPLCH